MLYVNKNYRITIKSVHSAIVATSLRPEVNYNKRTTKVSFRRRSALIHPFIQTISTAPLQVHFYSEVLPTQHGYCAGVSRRRATGNCELRTCPRSLRGS